MANEHPYRAQPAKAFWRQTVGGKDPLAITDWYVKKWPITDARISAAGSCFAQHVGRHLRNSGFRFIDVEPPPAALRPDRWLDYGYTMYSGRYGNVYSPRQLLQLLQRAKGTFKSAEPAWAYKGGYVDPFRPTIEPEPYATVAEMETARAAHLRAVRRMFRRTDVFVFTLGLTEAWRSKVDGAIFPVCPGTQGGEFDPARYEFVNFSYDEIHRDLTRFMKAARRLNRNMRFIFTVSPVPLAATATQKQVAVATMYSKSVLRAVAGYLADTLPYVDYFPSFEIVSSHVMHGMFYEPDQRNVMSDGVEHVMKQFFSQHQPPQNAVRPPRPANIEDEDDDDVVCDEELLAAFGDGKQ
jgi:hypothetical protein